MRPKPLTLLITAALAFAIYPALASAAAPVKVTTTSGPFTISDESCGFPVVVEPRQDKLRIFTFSDGRQIITGSYLATATNPENGKSLDINLSGQAVFEPNPDGSATFITNGNTLFFLPGSVQLIHGPIVFDIDSNGDATITVVSSGVTDVCAILSDP
jgi:hypothetical protein